MSLHSLYKTSTDGVFVCVACLIDDGAHFRHGFDRNDALDGKVCLVVDSQSIRRRPSDRPLSVMRSMSTHKNDLLIMNKKRRIYQIVGPGSQQRILSKSISSCQEENRT